VFDWLAREPERARDLMGAAHDLSQAAFAAPEQDPQDPAPSSADAAPEGTSARLERRDHPGRYGLTQHQQRPTWAL
jgi:hypothetical protein